MGIASTSLFIPAAVENGRNMDFLMIMLQQSLSKNRKILSCMLSRPIPLIASVTYANSIKHTRNNKPVNVLEFGPLPPFNIDNY